MPTPKYDYDARLKQTADCPHCGQHFDQFARLNWLGYFNAKDRYSCSECGGRFTICETTGVIRKA